MSQDQIIGIIDHKGLLQRISASWSVIYQSELLLKSQLLVILVAVVAANVRFRDATIDEILIVKVK